eukprot:4422674-Prymnesium_polylepis.1
MTTLCGSATPLATRMRVLRETAFNKVKLVATTRMHPAHSLLRAIAWHVVDVRLAALLLEAHLLRLLLHPLEEVHPVRARLQPGASGVVEHFVVPLQRHLVVETRPRIARRVCQLVLQAEIALRLDEADALLHALARYLPGLEDARARDALKPGEEDVRAAQSEAPAVLLGQGLGRRHLRPQPALSPAERGDGGEERRAHPVVARVRLFRVCQHHWAQHDRARVVRKRVDGALHSGEIGGVERPVHQQREHEVPARLRMFAVFDQPHSGAVQLARLEVNIQEWWKVGCWWLLALRLGRRLRPLERLGIHALEHLLGVDVADAADLAVSVGLAAAPGSTRHAVLVKALDLHEVLWADQQHLEGAFDLARVPAALGDELANLTEGAVEIRTPFQAVDARQRAGSGRDFVVRGARLGRKLGRGRAAGRVKLIGPCWLEIPCPQKDRLALLRLHRVAPLHRVKLLDYAALAVELGLGGEPIDADARASAAHRAEPTRLELFELVDHLHRSCALVFEQGPLVCQLVNFLLRENLLLRHEAHRPLPALLGRRILSPAVALELRIILAVRIANNLVVKRLADQRHHGPIRASAEGGARVGTSLEEHADAIDPVL